MTDQDPNARGPITNAAGDGVETTGVNAAQGRRGTHTLRVLAASLLLVVLVLFGLYFMNRPHLNTNGGAGGSSGTNNANAAAEFHTDTSVVKQTTAGMPATEPGAAGAGESRAANTTH